MVCFTHKSGETMKLLQNSIPLGLLRRLSFIALPTLMAFLFVMCSTVPLTGRKQLSLIPSSQMLSMSYQEYGNFLKSNMVQASIS